MSSLQADADATTLHARLASESPFSIDLHTIVPLTFRNHEHSHREESEKRTTNSTSQQHRTLPHHHHHDEKEDIMLILASTVPLTLLSLLAVR